MLKKILTYSLVVTTMVWSVGLLATPLAVGAASSGDLIKLQCSAGAEINDPCKAVYYLGADNKRYVFPNEKTYKTWYSDFSGVNIVSSTEMSSYPIGGNVTYRPGVKLVKITTDPKVYAVSSNGTLHWVTTGELAEALYGSNWAQMVDDVSDAFFVNYTVGEEIDEASDYDRQEEMENAPTINDDKNLGEADSSGSSVTVALAADTPATGIVIKNSVNNKFTKVNFTASADGDVVIDSLVVERGGTVASDGPFSSVALIDASTGTRIGDARSLNSQHQATFNQDFTVAAGTTRSVYIVGNMGETNIYAGEIPTLNLVSVDAAGNTNVAGSLPIIGNYQNINGTITPGTLTVTDGVDDPDASTQRVGTTNYTVSAFKLSANSTEDFHVTHITLDQGGTADAEDIMNLDLYADNVLVGTVAQPSSDMITFDFSSNPILIAEGKNKEFRLELDVVSGSGRTVSYDIKDESDIRAMGQTYGAEVKVACGGGQCTTDGNPFWNANDTTIDKGSLSINAAQFDAANVAEDNDDVVLGKFEFEARGEAIMVNQIPMNFIVNTGTASTAFAASDITNVELVDENGTVVAGPVDAVAQNDPAGSRINVGVTSTDSFTVATGKHVYSVRADLSADFSADDTIQVYINNTGVTGEGEITGLDIDAFTGSPTSALMTVKTASLSASVLPTPSASTIVAGAKDYVFANLNLTANSSGEDVEVTQVKVAVKSQSAGNPDDLSDFRLWDGSTELSVSNTPDSGTDGASNNGSATVTFRLSTPLLIAKGTSKNLKVSADTDVNASGAVRVGMDSPTGSDHITARGKQSGSTVAITISQNSGQLQTFGSTGSLSITRDTSFLNNQPSLLPSLAEKVSVGKWRVTAQNETVNIEEMYITVVQANSGGIDQISKLYLMNGSEIVAEVTPTTTDGTNNTIYINQSGDPIVIEKGSTAVLTVAVDTPFVDNTLDAPAGEKKGSSGQGFYLKINAVADIVAKGAQSGTTLASGSKTLTQASTTAQYLFKSVPVVTPYDQLTSGEQLDLSKADEINGTQSGVELYKFKVTPNSGGRVALHHVAFRVATNTATVTNLKVKVGSQTVALQPSSGALRWINYAGGTNSGTGVAVFYFVNNGTAPAAYNSSNVVPREVTDATTFTLVGDVLCDSLCHGSSNSGSVQVQLLGDAALPSTLPNAATTLSDSAADLMVNSFLWSDLWRTSVNGVNDSAASSSLQWSNGAFVATADGTSMEATSTAATLNL